MKTSDGITLADYDNHYIMVFDLRLTEKDSHDFIHPELANRTISVEPKIDAGLGKNAESLSMGERESRVNSDRKTTETLLWPKLVMDNLQINY